MRRFEHRQRMYWMFFASPYPDTEIVPLYANMDFERRLLLSNLPLIVDLRSAHNNETRRASTYAE